MLVSNESSKYNKSIKGDVTLSNELLTLVDNFEKQRNNKILSESVATGEIKSHEQNYIYDYHSDVLSYQDVLFYEDPELDNAIVSESIVKYLRGSEEDLKKIAENAMQ